MSLTGDQREKHSFVTGPEAPCILGMDYLKRGHLKDPKGRQYRTNRDVVIPIHKMIRKLESQGVVSRTHSPFNSPIWPVHKSDGEWRLTVDYRDLNKVTPPLSAAVPDMLELQYELESKGAKWYTTTDIANAFFSIPLAAKCRPQFAFTWRGKNQKWKAAVWSPTRWVAEATEGKGESSQFAELKAVQLALDIAEREGWPRLYLYTDSWMIANGLWGWLDQWKKMNWRRRGKPIWAADLWQDVAAKVKKLNVRVRHVDACVPKGRANEEHDNNRQADRAAQIEVSQVDLDWQQKGELFLA
ncbi:hypothetical protein WISP_88876 [Willisornis vidua]|uniref:RNase H type-1 domain-containing protein n=1 Tax=Willisornis vidua TaxID=1566151 RepID=A0ABQ9D2H8_9PASS|nr:hypothetical protein WISP_88876 [Willisornis vidua]